MARCIYRYKDDGQCIIKAEPDSHYCKDHNTLINLAKNQKRYSVKRQERKKKEQQMVKPPPAPSSYDHTAPWRCSLDGCDICKDKPTYKEYMENRYGFTR